MNTTFSLRKLRPLVCGILALTSLLAAACKKENVRSDSDQIQQYLTDKGITNAQVQASGLVYVPVLTNPAGVRATAGSTAKVLYTGYLLQDGSVFDASSRHGNVPFGFVLGRGQVIQGWDEGIALMRKGEKAQLLIPSALGYGAAGAGGGAIPPNAVLRFDVELVDVQ